jgi:hypothetical protein
MKTLFRTCYVLFISVLLSSCAMNDVNHYKDQQPRLDLEKYFIGTSDAWGMFQQRDGSVVKRFKVTIEGKKIAEQLVLDEKFEYDDGSTQQRIWRLSKQADGSWHGTADDVKGIAVGQIAGNALHWQYTLLLPVSGSIYEMQMDDWMYLMDQDTLINRTSMRKFGVELGQVTLFFRRRPG